MYNPWYNTYEVSGNIRSGYRTSSYSKTTLEQKKSIYFNLLNNPEIKNAEPQSNISDVEFWRLVNKLRWQDMTERKLTENYLNRFNPDDLNIIYTHGSKFVGEILNAYKDKLKDYTEHDRLTFAWHIVAKGQQSYNVMIAEKNTDFYQYIMNEKQDFYQWCKKSCGILTEYATQEESDTESDEEDIEYSGTDED